LASRELAAQFEALGIKLAETARSLQAFLQERLTRLSAASRSKFEVDFPQLCREIGLLPITGSIENGYRIRGAIEIRTNFVKGHLRVSTISEIKTVSPPTAQHAVDVVRAIYKRLYERPFQPSEFERSLVDAFFRAGGREGDSVLVTNVHQQLFLSRQKTDFFRDTSAKRLVAYPLDEFSVDLGQLLHGSVETRTETRRFTLELGRDGVIVFTDTGAFESYKFLRVTT
jgi:hypothetical protein